MKNCALIYKGKQLEIWWDSKSLKKQGLLAKQ